MDKIFKISELISTDIRSRANANIIRSAIDGINERIVLDFDGVCFISRSFTDELYNVLEEHKNISFTNTSDNIKAMLDAVEKGRKSTRNFSNSSEIKEFHDFASLILVMKIHQADNGYHYYRYNNGSHYFSSFSFTSFRLT